jgi:flagellar motor switch protein FliM
MSQRDAPSNGLGDGLRHLIEAPGRALDKAPKLQGVFERLASGIAQEAGDFCSVSCSVDFGGISPGSAWDLLNESESGIVSVFSSPEWGARIIIGCDRRFLFTLIDAMYGGDGLEAQYECDLSLTGLERSIAREFAIAIAGRLRDVLEPICATTFIFEDVGAASEASTMGVGNEYALMARFAVRVMGGTGRFFVLIPNSALAPFRKRFETERVLEPANIDPFWAEKMRRELERTEITVRAVLDGPQMTLSSLAQLKVGQILPLRSHASSLIRIEVDDQSIFAAKVGQSSGVFTVSIERRFDEGEELLVEIANAQHDTRRHWATADVESI